MPCIAKYNEEVIKLYFYYMHSLFKVAFTERNKWYILTHLGESGYIVSRLTQIIQPATQFTVLYH